MNVEIIKNGGLMGVLDLEALPSVGDEVEYEVAYRKGGNVTIAGTVESVERTYDLATKTLQSISIHIES